MSVWTSAIRPGDEQRQRADAGGRVLDRRRLLEDRVRARDQVDAGGDHRRRVDERADRRRALHRVRQPRVQRDLRRLRDRAAEQAERDEVHGRRRELPARLRTTVAKASEPVCGISRKSASAIVASPKAFMMNAFFAAATALGRSCQKPISRYDERPTRPQPTSSSSRFAALHEQEHREDEERHVREVAALLVVAVHVADRVEDDQAADAGDDQHHHRR